MRVGSSRSRFTTSRKAKKIIIIIIILIIFCFFFTSAYLKVVMRIREFIIPWMHKKTSNDWHIFMIQICGKIAGVYAESEISWVYCLQKYRLIAMHFVLGAFTCFYR